MIRSFLIGSFLMLCFGTFVSGDEPAAPAGNGPASQGFSLQEKPGEHLDILLDGHIAARYMFAHDKANLNATYKPYLHIFDAAGEYPITKGVGGLYTHHRGIFIGWNKMGFGGKTYDRWHMKGGEIVHQKFLVQKAGPEEAVVTSQTHWNDEAGKPILVEERTMTFRRGGEAGRLLVDFQAKLSAPNGEVALDGDPEHSGVHYRPAHEVDYKKTLYVFPKEKASAKNDVDLPWVGETYTLKDKRHSVVQMNHPGNPKGTKFSAYRNYGRFGAFFVAKIPAGQSLTLNYRFLVADGAMPSAETVQKCFNAFAGTDAPTPKTSVVPADK